MQERKWNGTDKLTDFEEMIKKASSVEKNDYGRRCPGKVFNKEIIK